MQAEKSRGSHSKLFSGFLAEIYTFNLQIVMAAGLVHCPWGLKKVYKEMLFKIFLDINKLFLKKENPNQTKTKPDMLMS